MKILTSLALTMTLLISHLTLHADKQFKLVIVENYGQRSRLLSLAENQQSGRLMIELEFKPSVEGVKMNKNLDEFSIFNEDGYNGYGSS